MKLSLVTLKLHSLELETCAVPEARSYCVLRAGTKNRTRSDLTPQNPPTKRFPGPVPTFKSHCWSPASMDLSDCF